MSPGGLVADAALWLLHRAGWSIALLRGADFDDCVREAWRTVVN